MKTMTFTDSLQTQVSDTLSEQVIPDVDTCMQVTAPAGMQGELLPYKPESDEAVLGAIFLCFVLILLALQKGSKSLLPYLKNVVVVRRRTSLFDERNSSSSVQTVALSLSTMVGCGLCLYHHYADEIFFYDANHFLVLAAYFAFFVLLIAGKSIFYNFVNWIFFEREKAARWKENYWGLMAATGVVLFPTVLYVTFLDFESQNSDYLLLTILSILKILLFYKLIRNFFTHLYGVSHLILYFCALEIIPDLILWKGVEIFNNVFLKL